MQSLFDRWIPGWKLDNFNMRSALNIPDDDLWRAHQAAKNDLCDYIMKKTSEVFSLDVLTLGFARRTTSYKRPKAHGGK